MVECPPSRRVFVVGAARSGTTLAVNLLGLHAELEPVFETGFVVTLLAILRGYRYLPPEGRLPRLRDYRDVLAGWARDLPGYEPHVSMPALPYGKVWLRFTGAELTAAMDGLVEAVGEDPAEDAFAAALRRFIEDLFALQAERGGKPGWVNKTPAYVEYLGELTRLIPEAVIVHVIRDCRDVACSLIEVGGEEASLEAAAGRTLRQVQAGLLFTSGSPVPVLEVRFEALVREPQATLAELFRRLGLRDESQAVLDAFRGTGFELSEAAVGRWRSRLNDRELAQLEAVLRPTLDWLGYPPASEAELAAMRGRPSRFENLQDPLAVIRYKARMYDEQVAGASGESKAAPGAPQA